MAANAVCLLSVISCRVSGDTESEGASIVTASCASGIAAGDGRDLFSLQSGRLLNIAGRLCVGEVGDVVGGALVLQDCDAASKWIGLGNGQLKINTTGEFCLSQQGSAPGIENVAKHVVAVASSTSNAFAHGSPTIYKVTVNNIL